MKAGVLKHAVLLQPLGWTKDCFVKRRKQEAKKRKEEQNGKTESNLGFKKGMFGNHVWKKEAKKEDIKGIWKNERQRAMKKQQGFSKGVEAEKGNKQRWNVDRKNKNNKKITRKK